MDEASVNELAALNLNGSLNGVNFAQSDLFRQDRNQQRFQSSVFNTPPSLLASPQYGALFSSSPSVVLPTRGALTPSMTTRCTTCQVESRGARMLQFSTCTHKYCGQCAPLINDGRVCPACSNTINTNGRFSNMQFSSQSGSGHEDMGDMNTTLTSRLNDTVCDTNRLDLFKGIWGDQAQVMNDTLDSIQSLGSPVFAPMSPLGKSQKCSACQDGHIASHFCQQCSEMLCVDCVGAHQRVRMTRDHTITALDSLFKQAINPPVRVVASDSSLNGSCDENRLSLCSFHEAPTFSMCETCGRTPLCAKCIPEHVRHHIMPIGDLKSCVRALLIELHKDDKNLEDSIQTIHHMGERVEASVQAVASELRAEIHKHISALEERKRDLLQRVDTIRQSKMNTLKAQGDTLQQRRTHILQVLKGLEHNYDENDSSKLAVAFDQLMQICSLPVVCQQPSETDLIKFNLVDNQLITKIRSLGDLESGPCAFTSKIIGEGYKRAIRDRQCCVHVQLRDACSDLIGVAGYFQQMNATIRAPDGTMLEMQLTEREVGTITASYFPVQDGNHIMNITLRGVSISGCPVCIDVRRGRNYSEIAQRGELFHFGKEGSGDGELCRPWGICCDHKGRIIVADRSNNRLQIYDRDGKFLMKFGSGGTRSGQFDRPAGVCVNAKNNIIVADKDNHRIQVFDEMGNFVLKFGERGRPVGMFNYPWGVATNSHNHIAVSDTRNHRVQIFTAMGQFLRKCGFDTAYFYKHLDSPRGLCYLPDGQLLITDFNNHRVVLMGPRAAPDMKCYGTEGEQEGMFCRPQGVKTDPEGHILVCDSRNNRIQVFSAEDMRCVASFGGEKPTNQMGLVNVPPPTSYQMEMNAPFSAPPPSSTLFQIALPSQKITSQNQGTEQPALASSLLDRPTDLCVSPDGRIYVVDFGNNCIRVF